MDTLEKKDWLLIVLWGKPLDRIRLMKALFLIWHRSGRDLKGFFEFVPYMYGPCSFELYDVLESAGRERLISQAPHPVPQWARYFLTARGASAAESVARGIDRSFLTKIQSIAEEVESLGFYRLLQQVYQEAPDFALESVVTGRSQL